MPRLQAVVEGDKAGFAGVISPKRVGTNGGKDVSQVDWRCFLTKEPLSRDSATECHQPALTVPCQLHFILGFC
jgi:hypothetical protein